MQQPLFFVEQAFPCLEELELRGKIIMMMWQGQNAKSMQRLPKDNELKKPKRQLDEEANVQSSINDCEGSSSHLEIRDDRM
ncbi:hypothetical protein Q3G72_012918 [Acer saccharum]|nr:hypothetical protein Q3G72_012918 [Acer saccharum]